MVEHVDQHNYRLLRQGGFAELAQHKISRRTMVVELAVTARGIALLASSRQQGSSESNQNIPTPATMATNGLLFPAIANLKAAFGDIMKAENDHVSFLQAEIKKVGGTPRPKPRFQPLLQTDINTFAATAMLLENVGVGAYLYGVSTIKSRAVLLAIAPILTVEARHAGFLDVLLRKPISPNGPRDKALTLKQFFDIVAPFIVGLNGGPDPSVLRNDLDILNFALLLEYLEAEFYNMNVPKFFP